MSKTVSRTAQLKESFNTFCIKAALRAQDYAPVSLGVLIVGLVILGTSDSASAQQTNHPLYNEACNRLLGLMEGSFGALVTVAAGVGAIIASAVGGFKMAWTLVVVAVGAFILRAYVTLFFQGCGGF